MKQKKDVQVLYIITKLELGGAQKVCLALLDGLQESGETSHLISSAQGKLVSKVKNNDTVILLDSLKREISFRGIFNELKSFFQLIKHIRRLKKQYPNLIVHTHSTKAGIIGRFAALLAGVKKRVHTVHGYAFHNHQPRIIWLAIYLVELVTSLITTHYVCVSSEDVKIGIKLFPRFARKHSIIRAAVDWQQFYTPARRANPFPQTGEPFVFGTVSCFKKQKNLFDLLRAFKEVHTHNPHTKLELVGDGHLRPALEAWIEKHNLKNAIILHGWQENVASYMLDWHAFVLSSLWEGLPCSVIEARLLKLPVISYNTGGIHDVIMSGENGLLFQQGNWQQLAKGMLSLIADKPFYIKLQECDEDLSDFNTEQMVHEHIELYKNLTP